LGQKSTNRELEHLNAEAAELERQCALLEKSLQQSSERFRKIFHASANMMAITTVEDGRIVDVNDACAAMGGYRREELIGKFSKDQNWWFDIEHRDRISEEFKKYGRVHNLELEFRSVNGEPRRLLYSADPIAVGDEACLLSTLVDITARDKEAQALRKSEEKYRMLVEHSLQGLAIVQEGRIVFCNNAFASMCGYSVEELLHLSDPTTLIHPEDLSDIVNLHRDRVLGKEVSQSFEYRIIRKDGAVRWCEVFASLMEFNGKKASHVVHIDITERKAAEAALQDNEERFRLIAESIDEIFWIYDLEKAAVTYVSPAHERIWGYPRELFANPHNPFLDPIHPEDRERVLAAISNMKSGQIMDYEVRIMRSDGELRYIHSRGFPVRDKSGKLKYYVGVGQDVTESRRAEEALKAFREYMDHIINRIADPVFVKNREHEFVLVNEAFCSFFSKPPDAFLGKSNLEILPKELADSIWKNEEKVFLTGRESIAEETIPGADGTPHILMTRLSPLTDKNGRKHIVGVHRDITEHKKLETQFLQAQKMEAIGVLAGGVAHDFNNLLNVINGYTELILGDISPDDPICKDLQKIRDAGKQAAEMTAQLLAFGRKQILQPERIDLNTVLRQMSPMLRRLIGEDVDFVVSTKPGLGVINADPGQIQQVIMNLVVNARDAMPQGGKLVIRTDAVTFEDALNSRHPMVKDGPHILLSIRDNGVGMDAATQSHLFEPFFTTKHSKKRTGLGLSTVYAIVRQSGGFITVDSEPGKGSTFSVYFPEAVDAPAPQTNGEEAEADLSGSETVLVVEDEVAVRMLASRILSDHGYKVLEAPNGAEALRIAREQKGQLHLLLTDVVMPGMSGPVLASQLEAECSGIKILFMSGYTDDAIVRHGVLDSGVAFIQKPFTVDGLIRKVREVIKS